jgi:GntR family transcriptional regulator
LENIVLLEIDHHSGVPIYRQVIDHVRGQIMSGRLTAGQQVESVRELAGRLKVNPMTISKAYSFLEVEGLLQRRRGVGLFVAELKEPEHEQIKIELLKTAVEKAAITSIEFGVSSEEAIKLFKKIYRQHNPKSRRQK